ncbi:hypothetical protein QL285_028692 [Trifolium repens]|nr:hypothetical protein QL285_028692 [Trifolium repens]
MRFFQLRKSAGITKNFLADFGISRFPVDFTTLGNFAALSSNVVVSGFHRSNPHRSFSVAGPAPLQILLFRRSCFVDDPSPLSDTSPSSDASPSQSEFSAVQHHSVYRLVFLVLRAFSSTVMSSISSPHSFSQRFGILSFDCEGNERYYSNLNLHVLVVNLKFGIDADLFSFLAGNSAGKFPGDS